MNNTWMKKILTALALLAWAPFALAVAPYVKADNVTAGDLNAVMAQVEKKLQAGGFTVVGKHQPQGLAANGVIVVTDKAILDTIAKIGGDVIVGAGIRVGVKTDGTVSYMNPEYWYRAYFRSNYDANQAAVKGVEARLKTAIGAGATFGGDVEAATLAKYQYLPAMEYFEDKRDLATHASFEQAVEAVRANLTKHVGNTSKVYEVVMADKKIAVFGVALNDPKTGEGVWVNRIEGSENIAGLPYEVFVVGNNTMGLFARFRIALSWPALKMLSFGKIMSTPAAIRKTLIAVAGGTE